MSDIELIIIVAKSYNNLDYKFIEEIASDDIIYESQSVFSALIGKKKVIHYLKGKFNTIKDSDSPVFAEIGFPGYNNKEIKKDFSEYLGRPCIILSQDSKDHKVALVQIRSESGKLKRIDICTVAPHWSEAFGTGQYPE
jgi:hypothetical protein